MLLVGGRGVYVVPGGLRDRVGAWGVGQTGVGIAGDYDVGDAARHLVAVLIERIIRIIRGTLKKN